jgi:secreted trypsin-like serine protease
LVKCSLFKVFNVFIRAYSSGGAVGWNPQDSMICSPSPVGGKSFCDGDQGGPFFCGEQGSEVPIKSHIGYMLIVYHKVLVGIASWIGCHSGLPDVYTEVAYFVDWILETMATY